MGKAPPMARSWIRMIEAFNVVLIVTIFVISLEYITDPPLHMLAATDSFRRLEKELAEGRNIDEKAHSFYTPLHYAVINNQVESTRVLLSHGAEPGPTPLTDPLMNVAIYSGSIDVLRVMLEQGLDPSGQKYERDYSPPLFAAIYTNNPDAVALLLAHGADPLVTDSEGRTAHELAEAQPAIIKMIEEYEIRPRQ